MASERNHHGLPATDLPHPPLSGAARVLCASALQRAGGWHSGWPGGARTAGIVYLPSLELVSGLGALRLELVGRLDPAALPARLVAAAASRRAVAAVLPKRTVYHHRFCASV